MNLRIAILGIGLLAGAAALNAQSRIQTYGSANPGDATHYNGVIKGLGIQDASDADDDNSTRMTKPSIFSSSSPDDDQPTNREFDIAVFPIPAVDILNVEIVNAIPDEFIRATLHDSQGNRVPAHQERSGYLIQFEVHNLPPGRYRVEVITNTQEASRAIEIL